MSSSASVESDQVVPSGFLSPGGGKRGSHIRSAAVIAAMVPTSRQKPALVSATAEHISIVKRKGKRQAVVSLGPTPERLAKGDIAVPRTVGGFFRSLSMAGQLHDGRERGFAKPISRMSPDEIAVFRDKGKLDHDAKTSWGMFQAAEKLRRHHDGLGIGVRAQDLNRIIGGDDGDPEGEEAWVHNYKAFKEACRIMGWHDAAPHRGAGRITVAIVCEGMTVCEAARAHLPAGRDAIREACAMDRLREGLWMLASQWRMI